MQKTATLTGVLVGLFGGLALYRIAFMLGDFEVVSRSSLEQQQRRIAALEQDNLELADELFQPRASLYGAIDDGDLPYDGDDDASDEVAAARAAALMDKEFLMKFGVGVKCQSKPDKVSFLADTSYTPRQESRDCLKTVSCHRIRANFDAVNNRNR